MKPAWILERYPPLWRNNHLQRHFPGSQDKDIMLYKLSVYVLIPTSALDLVKESRKPKGGCDGGGPLPPDPATECCAACLVSGASGCLVLENMDCWCLYTGGGGGGTRNIDTNDELGSLLRVAP